MAVLLVLIENSLLVTPLLNCLRLAYIALALALAKDNHLVVHFPSISLALAFRR